MADQRLHGRLSLILSCQACRLFQLPASSRCVAPTDIYQRIRQTRRNIFVGSRSLARTRPSPVLCAVWSRFDVAITVKLPCFHCRAAPVAKSDYWSYPISASLQQTNKMLLFFNIARSCHGWGRQTGASGAGGSYTLSNCNDTASATKPAFVQQEAACLAISVCPSCESMSLVTSTPYWTAR